jgi:hypothetical protein
MGTRVGYKSILGNRLGIGQGNLIVDGRRLPQYDTGGNVFYVDSGATAAADVGAAETGGKSPDKPFATLDYAFSACTADNNDVIIVLAGHAENISAADGIDADVAGVTVIGMGSGASRPTFTYTAAAGEFTIGADSVTIENMIFNASVTSVLKGINVEDGVNYTTIRGCTFGVDTAGTDEFNATIYFENNNTGALIEDCTIDMGIAGAVQAIHMDADTDKLTIRNNVIRGDYSTANISGDTTLSTNLLIQGNILELLTGSYGTIADNYIVCNLATKVASVVADTCLLFENYYNEDIQGTGGLIGTVSADD